VAERCWKPGTRIGAVRDGGTLYLSVAAPGRLRILLDFARHRRVLNLDKNYARLNGFPEWFTVDEGTLYRVHGASGGEDRIFPGSELIAGIDLSPGKYVVGVEAK
jgi:hypothetical protein